MTYKRMPNNFTQLLDRIAEGLDIPDHVYEDVVLKYEDVGEWLGEEGSALAPYSPEIYPQGSFRLGTVVRPFTKSDQYDIDLVCQLAISKERTTQADLKKVVGDRLKARSDLAAILDESRRCWYLDYKKQFHVDVLPSLPNVERRPTGILLTDTELRLWQKSNPIAYADWFREQMKVAFEQKRLELAESRKADIEDVPEWHVRTPLQRVVQLLKRHRDMYFAEDEENRPVSIIITTLAARAYGNQMDLFEALTAVVEQMPNFIESNNGRYMVANPVEPDENFADKWNEKPARREAFFRWLDRARQDYLVTVQDKTITEAVNLLSPVVGADPVQRAASSLGIGAAAGALIPVQSEVKVPNLGSIEHRQYPPWPERLTHKARVRGGVYMLNKKGRKLWDLSGRPVPKRVALKFTVDTNVRAPYEVRWQVVNTGEEARVSGDLRGGFDGEAGSTRWETAKYTGTHWIEAFIVKDGVCVARSGRTLVKVRG